MIPPEADLAQTVDERSGERAQVGASDLLASPLSEGNRRFWMAYIKKCAGTQAGSAIHCADEVPPGGHTEEHLDRFPKPGDLDQ